MAWALSFLAKLAVVYLIYMAAMVWLHPRFLYPFDQTAFQGVGYRVVDVAVEGQAPLPVQVAEGRPGAPVILYFMGNVGALELFRPMLEHHREKGRTVVAMPYRGAGGVSGRSSEASIKRDALAVYDAVLDEVPEGPIVVQGYSMGTGVALHVASERDVDSVVLSAPYDRLCALMGKRAWLPACWLPWVQKWDNLALVPDVTAPVYIVHGSEDALIVPERGRRLFDAFKARNHDAGFRTIDGAGHSDLIRFPGYLEGIDAFLGD